MKLNFTAYRFHRFLFLLFFAFTSLMLNAQINIQQNFNASTTLPSGWTTSVSNGFEVSASNACNGNSARDLIYSSSTNAFLATPNQVSASNGTDVNVSFSYKVINYTGSGATPNGWGTIDVQYSLNNGSSWTTAFTVNSSNHTPSTSCAVKSFTIPAANVPSGSSFKLRFSNTYLTGQFYVYLDNVSVLQTTPSPPDCNADLTSPLNGAANVPVSQNQISWSNADGLPDGYRLNIGTTSGGTQIANNLDVGNVNSYGFTFNYQTTYYVKIIPYNENGSATGCAEQSFTTVSPVTEDIPWEEGFTATATPNGWTKNSFVIGTTTRLPDADTNIIYKNLRNVIPTENFSTVSAGEIQNGDELSFQYRFADYNTPFGPPAAGAGNFIVAVSTDYGVNYTNVQTVNSDGTAGWKEFNLGLSGYAGEFVKIKITGNWVSGNWVVGFDDFYIGNAITCDAPEDLNLEFVGANDAQLNWDGPEGAEEFNWYLFPSGANPETDSPSLSGSTTDNFVHINGILSSTDYDFYVKTNCGETDGTSVFSDVLSFSTVCEIIDSFPFTETFENSSPTLDCWSTEFVNGTTEWFTSNGASGGNVIQAHNGTQNAIFYFDSPFPSKSKLVSPPLGLTGMTIPKLRFWYANQVWNGQNELRVYYKNASSAEWVLIPGAVYANNVDEWTEVELDLPDVSDEYYLAFEGTNDWGYGIVIDDIEIYDFDSCPDSTIWDGLTWSNGEPAADKKAIIDGNLLVNQDFEVCELEITTNGNLEIASGNTLTVHKKITNNAAAQNFIVDNDANLIQIEDKENTGEITVLRNSQPFKRLDYTMWSSPVSGQQIQGFSPETLPNRIYTYEGENGYVAVPNVNSDFTEAKGYMFRSPNNWNQETSTIYPGEFTGVPINGTQTIAVQAGNYTSVGNPYPSNIDADLLFDANPGLTALYFWTNTNPTENGEYTANNYAAYTYAGGVGSSGPEGNESNIPNGIISTGQGFIVADSDNTLAFDNTMRTSSNADFFKNPETEMHRYWLNFTKENGASLNQIMVAYIQGATYGFDNQIDAVMFGYSGSSFYSIIDGQKLVIQGRPLPFDEYDVVQMGAKITEAGNYSVSVSASDGLFAEGQQIYILDKDLNLVHNLTESAYSFYSEVGEFNNRFDMIYIDQSGNCPKFTVWNGLAWNNGNPDADTKAIFNGDFTSTEDLEFCELEVAPNGNLTISEGTNFTVNGIIINRSDADEEGFIVENNANLIQTEAFTDVNEGEIKAVKNSRPMIRLNYTMWSSPVSGQQIQAFSPETLPNRIYTYEGENNYVQVPDVETDFSSAKGYMFRAPNNFDSTDSVVYEGNFIGIPTNGNYSVNTYAGNFTSVGNPYPSNIDAVELMNENGGIDAFYFWVNSPLVDGEYVGNNYASYNLTGGTSNTGNTDPGEDAVPNGIISKGQGFIVKSSDSNVNFNNSMRTTETTDFFKTDDLEKHRFWLNLKNGDNVGMNQILVGYIENASNGFDPQMDASFFGYEGSALYNLIENKKFTIQGRALPFDENDVVPIGFKAINSGKFIISIADSDGLFAEGQPVFLKDNLLGILHNLAESDYEFESEEGEFNSRFEIVYKEDETMSDSDFAANEIQIYKNGNFIEIRSREKKISNIEIYDLSGRKLYEKENLNRNFYQINSKEFGTQILVIKVETNDKLITSKKLIP